MMACEFIEIHSVIIGMDMIHHLLICNGRIIWRQFRSIIVIIGIDCLALDNLISGCCISVIGFTFILKR